MSLSVCLLAFCALTLGTPTDPPAQASVAYESYSPNEVRELLALAEFHRAIVGAVDTGRRRAIVAGATPLRFSAALVTVEAGMVVSSAPLPIRGTHVNWMARVEIAVTRHTAIGWTHLSNSGLTRGPNPSVDALAFIWRL